MKKICKKNALAALIIMVGLVAPVNDIGAKDENGAAYHPVITAIEGTVKIMGMKYSVWETATEGTLLLTGDTIKTGWGSMAQIQFLSGKIHLYENSILVIPSMGVQDRRKDIQEVVVEEGDARFNINPLGVRKQFEFRTKNIQGGVKGTVFNVGYLDGGTNVSVSEGTVWVSDVDGSRNTLRFLSSGDSIRVEEPEDLLEINGVNPDFSPEDYSYNVPPGQDAKSSLPADYNSNPDNNGERTRGVKDKDKETDTLQ
jgi:hypothetical protein